MTEGMNSVGNKTKEEKIDISKGIEESETEEGKTILVVDKYGIRLSRNNYIVGRKNPKYNPMKNKPSDEFFDVTFHPTIHQALIQLSKRIFEDKLNDACREKPLELKELVNLIKQHHEYFVSLTKGL